MASYRLAPKATDDLEEIWRYTATTHSVAQADIYVDQLVAVFDLIAKIPDLARLHEQFTPPVRIHRHQSHLVVYGNEGSAIIVWRLLGGRQNWQTILAALD